MPFDSFMTAALTHELSSCLVGLKVDKVCQPERDEIDLLFHLGNKSRLVINCTASTPYMALSSNSAENPAVPPMMCMLLRKHLTRAKICEINQIGFDRIIHISFDSGDEMGFRKTKHLYCEMMGRGSNLIFADEDQKILAAFRQNDITTKFDRVIMVGSNYQPMPIQNKIDPIACTKEAFYQAINDCNRDMRGDIFLQNRFLGFGKLTAREILYRACSDPEGSLDSVSPETLWSSFSQVMDYVRNRDFSPCLIFQSKEAYLAGENPVDFSFMPITQFQSPYYVHSCQTPSDAIENYYLMRNRSERQKQHYNDIAQILKNCKNRLQKKIDAQTLQLTESEDAELSRLKGDLIIQEMYRIHRGDRSITAMDYNSGMEVVIQLDETRTPSQNAQIYYKEYNKKKTALIKIGEQIEIAKSELEYAESILSSLEHAQSASDLAEIRMELSHWSYGRRLTGSLKKPSARQSKAKPRSFITERGNKILIGMNNYQNDEVSTRLIEKEDLWFHVKDYHGSHVLLKKVAADSLSNQEIERAASLAAFYSEVKNSDRVEVDYTLGRYVKKPNGAKPGFVTYKNHTTVIVKPKSLN